MIIAVTSFVQTTCPAQPARRWQEPAESLWNVNETEVSNIMLIIQG